MTAAIRYTSWRKFWILLESQFDLPFLTFWIRILHLLPYFPPWEFLLWTFFKFFKFNFTLKLIDCSWVVLQLHFPLVFESLGNNFHFLKLSLNICLPFNTYVRNNLHSIQFNQTQFIFKKIESKTFPELFLNSWNYQQQKTFPKLT